MTNRWGFYSESGAVHRDWRSLRLTNFSSQLGLGGTEMKRSTKKVATKNNETAVPIVVSGVVVTSREYYDYIGRDPRSVR